MIITWYGANGDANERPQKNMTVAMVLAPFASGHTGTISPYWTAVLSKGAAGRFRLGFTEMGLVSMLFVVVAFLFGLRHGDFLHVLKDEMIEKSPKKHI